MGPAAPAADPPGRMARPRRTTAPHRGHRHPPGRGEATQRRGQQAGMAVVVGHRRHRGGRRPLLAVLPPALRHRTHISAVQADPRVDQAPAPQLGNGRPVDLAGDRRLCPAPTRPTAGRRPPQALGETDRAEQTNTRPRPQRVQEPVHEGRLTSRCTETIPPRALAGHQVRKTAALPRVTTWGESSPPASRSADPPTTRWAPDRAELVKRQAQRVFTPLLMRFQVLCDSA